jgi:O-antigen/teichoic acid export membrane protein
MIKKIKNKLNGDIHLKDLVKGSAITFVLKMGGMGLSYVLIYLISKQLGAEGVGFYNLMLQILTVLGMVLGLGMNIAVLRYVGQFNNEEQRPKMRDLYRHFVRTVAPLTVLVGVLLYFGADYIVQWTGKDQEYADGLKMVGIVLPFFTINQISVEFIRGLKQLQISELVRSVLRPLVMILGIYFLFWNQLTKMDVIYLLVVGLIINSLVSRWAIWKKLKNIPKQPLAFERKELLKTSYPMMVGGLSNALMIAFPILFLDFYFDQIVVGLYSVSFKISAIISLILIIVNTIAAPKFAELFWKNEKKKLQRLINQSSTIMFWGGLILLIGVIMFSKQILGLFGKEFEDSQNILIILCIGQFVNTSTGSVMILLNMSGNQTIYLRILIVSLILTTISLWIITPIFGIVGVALIIFFKMILVNIAACLVVFFKINIVSFYWPFKKIR